MASTVATAKIAGSRERMASVSFDAVDLYASDARLGIAVERAIVRLPSEAIGADFGEGILRAHATTIRRHTRLAQQPAVALAGEVTLREAALPVEGPRAKTLLHG